MVWLIHMLSVEVWLFSCCRLWRDLIWVTLNYWDARGWMVNSGVLLLTQWRLLGALRKSWLFKLWMLQGNIRGAWLNLWAHAVSLICSRINLVKKMLRMESVNRSLFQMWRSLVSREFIAFQWTGCLRWEEQSRYNLVWTQRNSQQISRALMIHERVASARARMRKRESSWG